MQSLTLWRDRVQLLLLALKQQFGRRFWLSPLLLLPWPIYKVIAFLESGQLVFTAKDAQNELIGLPLYIYAIGLGVGLVAREIEGRTLEVSYSISGGCQRLWWLKLGAATLLIVMASLLLALLSGLLFTSFPPEVLLRVWQGATFFLVLAMGCGALLRSELAAALVAGGVLLTLFTRFEDKTWSPIFNPLLLDNAQYIDLTPALVQNHVGTWLLIGLLLALTFHRAEQRETLLN